MPTSFIAQDIMAEHLLSHNAIVSVSSTHLEEFQV